MPIPIRRNPPSPIPAPERKKAVERVTSTLTDAKLLIKAVSFLVTDFIPYGMLTVLLGMAGTGKSMFLLLALIRPIVNGGMKWFTGEPGPVEPGYVLLLATENDLAATLQRCEQFEVNTDNILLLDLDDPLRAIDLTSLADREQVEKIVKTYKPVGVFLDSYRGGHSGDENSSISGESVKWLCALAVKYGFALVVVHHTRKLGEEEMTADSSRGSNVIIAQARSVIGLDRPDKNNPACRIRLLKENLGIRPEPVGFLITDQGLVFDKAPEKPVKRTEIDDTIDWLKSRLRPGEILRASEIIAEGKQLGYAETTIRRAATEHLGIRPKQVRNGGKIREWTWSIPPSESEESRPVDR